MVPNPLLELFGRSPIRPIQEHMEVVTSAAEELIAYFTASKENNWEQAENIYNKISEIEERADTLKTQLRLQLPKSLFLPVPRTDLLELLSMQDRIANIAKDISGVMLGRKMHFPDSLQPLLLEFVQTSIATAQQALKAIEELDELLESGFSGKELDVVERLVEELNGHENKADKHEVAIRRELFSIESTLPPVDVMFLYHVIELIGELADCAQKVGSRLLLLLAR